MSLRHPWEEAVLSGEEITKVRQVLADCSAVLTAVQETGGPGAGRGHPRREA